MITKGEWEVTEGDHEGIKHIVAKFDGTEDDFATIWNFNEQAQANAKLIAEAGTVFNETGYTPRQLVDRIDELEAALDGWEHGSV